MKVGDKTFDLRLSFKSLSAIEDEFDKTIFDQFGDGLPSAKVTVFALSKMAGVEQEEAFDIIKSVGILPVIVTVKEVIISTLNPEQKTGNGEAGES